MVSEVPRCGVPSRRSLLSDVAVYSLVSQDGKSVLDLASIYGHAEVVQALLDAGADKDAKSGEVGGGCEVMGGVV